MAAAAGGAQNGGEGRPRWRRAAPGVSPHRAAGRRPGTRGGGEGGGRVAPPPGGSAPSGRCRRRRTAMRFRGGTALAGLLLALCVWAQVPRRSAAGTAEVVFGKVGGSILLLCRNVSKEATEVLWFQGDPHSFPPLFSSRVAFPPDVRFSLVDNSSLRISELRLQDEGNYTCKEVLNKTDHEHRVQLLVANPPRSTPKCWAETSSSGLMLQLFCSWPGGYPHPTLHWTEEGHDLENSSWLISSTSSSDTHVETLNSSHLSHRKVFKCVGSHVVEQEEPACSVEIKVPSLELEPPKTCFVGDNVTLTCRVTESVPAARLTWLRGITQPEIEPGGRYFIAQEGNVSHLTIQNCSQGTDGGCYVCKAQNPVGLREVFVCLTVKQPTNIVGVVGAVVVLSLMAVLTISGVVLYYNPLLCLKGAAFRSQDSDDILVLVDSEDDDDDEGNGEEDTRGSSTKHEVMALVNGNSIQAAYLNCPTEGDEGEQPSGVPLQRTSGEDARGT